jgi:hypothetical protein
MRSQALFAVLLVASAAAASAQPEPGAAIRRAMAAQGPIVSAQDRATIRVKCGLTTDEEAERDINFRDGALSCPDGRVVRDAETAALGERIGARASAHARAALSDPAVVAAIDAYADRKSREAIRRLRESRR